MQIEFLSVNIEWGGIYEMYEFYEFFIEGKCTSMYYGLNKTTFKYYIDIVPGSNNPAAAVTNKEDAEHLCLWRYQESPKEYQYLI